MKIATGLQIPKKLKENSKKGDKEMDNLGGIKLLLNGGKEEMNSATIPVQWFFSDEILAKKPRSLLLIEVDEEEITSISIANHGRRYLFKIDEAVAFIQLFRPGRHQLVAIAFNNDKTAPIALLLAGNYSEYSINYAQSVYVRTNDDGSIERVFTIESGLDDAILAATMVTFDVPAELFAAKPRTRFGKALWWWANYLHKKDPIDQCDYRRRLILAFTLKVPVMPILAGAFLILGTFYSLYVLIASLVCLFFGYRPNPILKSMRQAFSGSGYKTYRVNRYGTYRQWFYERTQKDVKDIRMPVTPAEVTAIVSALGILTYLAFHSPKWDICLASLFACSGILLAALAVILDLRFHYTNFASRLITPIRRFKFGWWERRSESKWIKAERFREKKEEKLRLQELQQEKNFNNFMAQFSWANVPEDGAVDLKKIPKPLTAEKKIVQKFRVSYWALKAEICKPFSR